METLKSLLKSLFNKFGFTVQKTDDSFFKLDPDFKAIYDQCRPFTMTSLERIYALYKATEYIVKAKIPGDFVECGVWRGGSAMVVALTLMKLNSTDKKIYLYDTYEGMTQPSSLDVDTKGNTALSFFKKTQTGATADWCYSPIDEVQKNLAATKYPPQNLVYVKGKVEDTIPGQTPAKISLLRLDTDWHDSTYHEMKHLYPLITPGGVLILDDYGHWQGARLAVDEYIKESGQTILLNRIDFSGRVGIKL